jgi:hypothetical protein
MKETMTLQNEIKDKYFKKVEGSASKSGRMIDLSFSEEPAKDESKDVSEPKEKTSNDKTHNHKGQVESETESDDDTESDVSDAQEEDDEDSEEARKEKIKSDIEDEQQYIDKWDKEKDLVFENIVRHRQRYIDLSDEINGEIKDNIDAKHKWYRCNPCDFFNT